MFNYLDISPDLCDYFQIIKEDELSDGERLFVEIDETPIVVFKIAEEIFAIGDVCSHDDGPLGDGDVDHYDVICPRHGARFDVRTGKAVSLPAIVDIPAYPIRKSEGYIEVGLPQQTD